jgi:hypothetical protein
MELPFRLLEVRYIIKTQKSFYIEGLVLALERGIENGVSFYRIASLKR